MNKFEYTYGILRTSTKGTGPYMTDEKGKFMFPHKSCTNIQAGPVVIKHTIDRGNYCHIFVKMYKMSMPSDNGLLQYLSENPQTGTISVMNDEDFGTFLVAPNGDILSSDKVERLCIIGKVSHLERKCEVINEFDAREFFMKKKFNRSYIELLSKFEHHFRTKKASDENIDFSHLSGIENQILRPKKTKAGIYYYDFDSSSFEKLLPTLSKADVDFLIDEFNNFNEEANYKAA